MRSTRALLFHSVNKILATHLTSLPGPKTPPAQTSLVPASTHPNVHPLLDPTTRYFLRLVDAQRTQDKAEQDRRFQEQDRRFLRLERQLDDLHTGTLPMAVPLTLKAATNTFSIAMLLKASIGNAQAYPRTIQYLRQLGWISRPAPLLSKAPLQYVMPVDPLDILAHTSFLISPITPQASGLASHRPRVLKRVMGQFRTLMPGVDDQRLQNNLLTTRVGGRLRYERNVAAHEVSLRAFLAVARAQQATAARGVHPPHPAWVEVLWLWELVNGGNPSLDESSISPYHLNLILYNMLKVENP